MNHVGRIAGLLLLWGCLLIAFSCQYQEEVVDGLPCRLTKDGKWGIVSTDGHRLLVPYSLEQKPSCVVNGMFTLPMEDGSWQLYRIENPFCPVDSRRFSRIGYFFEDVTVAQETPQSPLLLINKMGKTVFSTNQIQQFQIDLLQNYSEGRALFMTQEGKYGYLDTKGHIAIPPLYDCAYPFKEGVALVGVVDSKGYVAYQIIDKKGMVNAFLQVQEGSLDGQMGDGLLSYKRLADGNIVYLNNRGELVLYLPEEICESRPFVQGLAVFQTKTGSGVINRDGKIVINANYDDGFIAGKDRIALCLNGKYALADGKGRLLSVMEYDSIGRLYRTGLAVVKKDEAYCWIDREGQIKGLDKWACMESDAEAYQDIPQIFYRQSALQENNEVSEEKQEVSVKEKRSVKRVIDRNAWKTITEQSPFYNEMKQVLSGELEDIDAENRRLILNYVEHFRTSYTTKDIDFLEQLFSENALIVVGTVIRSVPQTEMNYLPEKQIIYNVKSKREYLNRLKTVFEQNQKIDVLFDEFRIMRHPTRQDVYGVTLRQRYESDRYSDDGYLFLLWDFQDRMAPKIHVRTWQPSVKDDKTPLTPNEVFSIRNFNLQ